METICPYALPAAPILDTYEQLNAAIGFKASPYPGLWINLYGGYQDLKDDFFEVQEETFVNYDPHSPVMVRKGIPPLRSQHINI